MNWPRKSRRYPDNSHLKMRRLLLLLPFALLQASAQDQPRPTKAEIEALIREASLDAAIEGVELDQTRLLKLASEAVPLATTMAEPIRKLREWAHRRTLHASTGTFK